jgi:hypothetical protein
MQDYDSCKIKIDCVLVIATGFVIFRLLEKICEIGCMWFEFELCEERKQRGKKRLEEGGVELTRKEGH